jgi:hypothetical protein
MTLVQIALAVKNVPFDEIVFVQYPVVADPADPNRVVPNKTAADQLWAALAANQPIKVTNDPNDGGGVIKVEPTPTPTPTETPAPVATPTPGATGTPTPAPSETAIELPDSIPGTSAADQTCSAGNLRAKG